MPKISELPARGAADGTELFPVLWNGQTMKARASTLFGVKGDKGEPGDMDGAALAWLDDFVQEGDVSASDAFQRCHDFLADSGDSRARIMLGAKQYHCHRTVLFDQVAIQVMGRGCPMATAPSSGTWLTFSDHMFTPFKFTRGAGESRGVGFYDLGLYQDGHLDLYEGWQPKDYPYIFDCYDLLGELNLVNVYCANINRLVKSVRSGRLNVRGLRGQIFTNAVYIDEGYDIARLFDWHLWTYWSSATEVLSYMQEHHDSVIMARSDTPIVGDIFTFAGNSQFRFKQSDFGITTKFTAGILVSDFTRYGLLVESPGFTAQIDALNHQAQAWPGGSGNLSDAKTIKVTQPDAMIQVATLQGTEMDGASISIEATNCNVNVGSALWEKINQKGGAGAVYAALGSNVFVNRYLIRNSGDTKLTAPGGALAASALIQNEQVGAVNYVFAFAGAADTPAKLYAEGPGAYIPLQLGAKGDAPVEMLSGLQLFPRKVADLPAAGRIGVHYVVDDATSSEGGAPVVGGGNTEAVVNWLNGAWRIAGGSSRASDVGVPAGAITRLVGESSEGVGVQQATADMVAQAPAVAALTSYSDEAQLRAAGAVLTGAAASDDGPALAAMAAASARGVAISIARPFAMRIGSPVLVQDKPFSLAGGAASYSLSQGTGIEIACPDAFDIRNSDGFSIRNAHIRSSGTALTSGSIFDFKASDNSSSNSGMLLFDNLRIEGGWNAFTFRKVFQAQLRGVRVANMAGEYCFGHNGLNDDSQANIFEYLGCSAGGVRYSNCDLWSFNGGGGSAKLVGCAGNFGRHGIAMRSDTVGSPRTITSVTQSPNEGFRVVTAVNHGYANGARVSIEGVAPDGVINGDWTITRINDTTFDLFDSEWVDGAYSGGTVSGAQGRDPGFVYFGDGGFENLGGDAFRLERGGKLQVSNSYFSTDSDGHVVNQFASYKGRHKFTNCDLRASGGSGLMLRAGIATYTGCDINNSGRVYVDNLKVDLSSCADNGAGFARFTSAAPHGYSTGDRVRTSRTNGCDGQTRITVISPTVFDADSIAYVAGAGGGQSWRYYRGLANVANNGAGLPRITVPGHPFREGEWVHFSTASFGVPGIAGSDFKIKLVDADNFDLVLKIDGTIPAFSGAFTSGGYVQRCAAQVQICAGAHDIDISGCFIGTSTSGVNRARYAVIIEPGCWNITIDSTISLDARSGVVNLSANEPTVRVTNRRLLPSGPTPPAGDNSTRLATTAFVRGEVGQSIQAQGAMLDKLRALTPAPSKLAILNSAGDAELIDWIINGTFVPNITCTTPGNLDIAWGTRTGIVSKRGKLVDVNIVLVFTPTYDGAITSGNLQISLPYVADSSTAYSLLDFSSMSGFTWPNNATQLFAAANGSQALATIIGQKSGATTATGQIGMFPSGQQQTLRISGTYRAAA